MRGAPTAAPPTTIKNIFQKWKSQTTESICPYFHVTSHSSRRCKRVQLSYFSQPCIFLCSILRTVLFLCIMFFICETPQCVAHILSNIMNVNISTECIVLTTLALLFDSFLNFCIYIFLNARFRQTLLELMKCSNSASSSRPAVNTSRAASMIRRTTISNASNYDLAQQKLLRPSTAAQRLSLQYMANSALGSNLEHKELCTSSNPDLSHPSSHPSCRPVIKKSPTVLETIDEVKMEVK